MVYNAALILGFINNSALLRQRSSLVKSDIIIGCCQRAEYALGNGMEEAGLLLSDPSFPLTSVLRVSAAFKSGLKPVCLSTLLALILVLKIIESLRLENTSKNIKSNQ